jgi:DNA-binding winged helix-turn-helix (wHTH) protein
MSYKHVIYRERISTRVLPGRGCAEGILTLR